MFIAAFATTTEIFTVKGEVMAKKWSEIQHKSTRQQRAKARLDIEQEYNRPWWRLVRFWDRARGRP
jgi:hypothetical protein